MGSSFSLKLLWPGKSTPPTPRVKVRFKCVFIHLKSPIQVCINTHEFEGHNLRFEGGRLGAGRPKRKSCPVQASDQTGAGDGASPAERYPDGNIQKHRKASGSEAEEDEIGNGPAARAARSRGRIENATVHRLDP